MPNQEVRIFVTPSARRSFGESQVSRRALYLPPRFGEPISPVLGREVLGKNGVPIGVQAGVLEDTDELPNVAGKRTLLQKRNRRRGYPEHPSATQMLQQTYDKKWEISKTLAEWRDVNRVETQETEQITVEKSVGNLSFQFIVRAEDQSDVCSKLIRVADPAEPPIFQKGQELSLRGRPESPYFVEENRASSLGTLNEAPPYQSVAVRQLLLAEEVDFESKLTHTRAFYRHEELILLRTRFVQTSCRELHA